MRQIIALGGGGFSMEPDNPLLDLYILKQANKSTPKVCFIPTASGDADNYIQRFYNAFHRHDCEPSHLSLFSPPTRDLESFILSKDILYVGGGNTKNLLALWKEWGLDTILRKAWEQGVILAGISAGSLCWFEQGVTDSFGDGLEPIQCLGFLQGSHCPHYDGESDRRPAYHKLIEAQEIQGGIAADDGVAIHYIDSTIHRVVSSRPKAKAYEVVLKEEVHETAITTVYLGDAAPPLDEEENGINDQQKIIAHHLFFIHEVHKLAGLDELILRMPIQQGKWSIVEIIAHFIPWDQFIMSKRIPYISTNEPLPNSPPVNEMNASSSMKAKRDSIQNTMAMFITTRNKLVEMLRELSEAQWLSKYVINNKPITLSSYCNGLMEHDLHHLKQIHMFLQSLK